MESKSQLFGQRRRGAGVIVPVLVVLVTVLLLFSGCGSTISAVGQILGDAIGAAAGDPVEDDGTSDVAESSESGESSSMSGQRPFGGLLAIQNVMLFNVAYIQVFFFGGHDPGFDDFREGEGITWEVTSSDESDQDSFTAERALLKRNADGTSWWYLAYHSGGESLEYEALLDQEYAPLEIAWKDADSKEVMRYSFEAGEAEAKSPDDSVGAEEIPAENRLGKERITVGSGTYTAEHIAYVIEDDGAGGRLEYDWWIAEEVPGDLIQYEYRQISGGDEASFTGELVAVAKGYVTQMEAY